MGRLQRILKRTKQTFFICKRWWIWVSDNISKKDIHLVTSKHAQKDREYETYARSPPISNTLPLCRDTRSSSSGTLIKGWARSFATEYDEFPPSPVSAMKSNQKSSISVKWSYNSSFLSSPSQVLVIAAYIFIYKWREGYKKMEYNRKIETWS